MGVAFTPDETSESNKNDLFVDHSSICPIGGDPLRITRYTFAFCLPVVVIHSFV